MRHSSVARALCAAALFSLSAGTVCSQQAEATAPSTGKPKVRALIDELLRADPTTRRELLRRAKRPASKLIGEFLDVAGRARETNRRVEIIRMIGELAVELGRELAPGADAAARRLIAFMEDEKRKKLKIAEALHEPKTRVGPCAAIALGELALFVDSSRDAVTKALEKELRERYGFHVSGVKRAYFRSLVHANGELKDLIEQLGHDVSYVREAAAQALGARGHEAREAVPALVAALNGEHPRKLELRLGGFSGRSSQTWDGKIWTAAARALVRIAPADKRTWPAHLRIVQGEEDPSLLVTSLRHVGSMGADAKRALGRLCKLLAHEDKRIAAEATTAIGMIGIANANVIAALERASQRKEKDVAVRATATLRMLNSKKKR